MLQNQYLSMFTFFKNGEREAEKQRKNCQKKWQKSVNFDDFLKERWTWKLAVRLNVALKIGCLPRWRKVRKIVWRWGWTLLPTILTFFWILYLQGFRGAFHINRKVRNRLKWRCGWYLLRTTLNKIYQFLIRYNLRHSIQKYPQNFDFSCVGSIIV